MRPARLIAFRTQRGSVYHLGVLDYIGHGICLGGCDVAHPIVERLVCVPEGERICKRSLRHIERLLGNQYKIRQKGRDALAAEVQ